jgi:Cu(I)/Ag(I) efflux system membrane fusion protein
VKVGTTVGETVEIVDGLKEGDRVVTSAQFLIDSESSLTAGLDKMQGALGPRPAMAEGKVVSMPSDDNKITISHGPIPELSWPAMTMDFAVGPGVSVQGISPGDRVRFGVVQTSDGTYAASTIERLSGAGDTP